MSGRPFSGFSQLRSGKWFGGAEGSRSLPALVVEPGRAIVGNAAILVTRVRAVQGKWAFLDASSNYLGESPLLLPARCSPSTSLAMAKSGTTISREAQ